MLTENIRFQKESLHIIWEETSCPNNKTKQFQAMISFLKSNVFNMALGGTDLSFGRSAVLYLSHSEQIKNLKIKETCQPHLNDHLLDTLGGHHVSNRQT